MLDALAHGRGSRLMTRVRRRFGWVVLVVFVPSLATTGSLVSRDDFICYDTTHQFHMRSYWPSVAIDSNGNINQINFLDVPGFESVDLHQYDRFDLQGNQLQPVINFLPDTLSDSIWETTGWYFLFCSEGGRAVVPYCADYAGGFVLRPFALFFDTSGSVTRDAICFMDDSGHADMITDCVAQAHGDINDIGRAVIAWQADRWMLEEYDSVFVRLYYYDLDSLGPYIEPLQLPQPPLEDPDPGWGGKFGIGDGPVTAMADDGSFVVAWEARYYEGYIANVLYVVYNADGTPRCDVQIANCLGGFQDTAKCTCNYINTLDVAMGGDGDFYIVWSGNVYAPTTCTRKQVWMRGFYADGTPKYDPIKLNDTDTLNVWVMIFPQVACDDSGNVVVCWGDSRLYPICDPDTMTYDVYVQRIDPDGNLMGPNMRVNNLSGIAGLKGVNSDCDLNDDGQVVVLWAYFFIQHAIQAQLMPLQRVGSFVPGDINYDLSANIADLTAFVDYLFGGVPNSFWPPDLIDLNGDGSNGNVADLTYLVDYFFFGGPEPHIPDPGVRPPWPMP